MKIKIEEKMEVIKKYLDYVSEVNQIYYITVTNENKISNRTVTNTLINDEADNYHGQFTKFINNYNYNSYDEFRNANWADRRIIMAVEDCIDDVDGE